MIYYTTKHKIPFEIDDEDYDFVSQHAWCRSCSGYIVGWVRGKTRRLHRVLMNTPDGFDTDHIDGNRMNNKKSNLRICTHSENVYNSSPSRDCASKYKGVGWNKQNKKWTSNIRFNGKLTHLGYFRDEKVAAQTYNDAAIRLFGKFARLNTFEAHNID